MVLMKPIIYADMQTMNTSDATLIPRNNFADTQNMIRRSDGLWENRKGIQQFGEDVGSGSPVHSLFFWKLEDGTRYLTVGSDDDIYSYAEGSSYNDGGYTAEQALTSDQQWDATVYRDTIVLGNGVDNMYSSTDNSTFTSRSGANIVKASLLEVGNDFVSFSGIVAEPNKFYLSGGAPANPWEYDTNNTLNVDIGNGENITAIKSLGANIVVCKSNKTYLVDLASLSRTTLDWAGGCESSRAIVQTQLNSVLVAGRQGIYAIAKTQIGSNAYFGNPENSPIISLYDTCEDYSTISSVYIPTENYALFSIQSSTKGDITLVKNLDYDSPVWTYFTGVNAKDWTIYEDSTRGKHTLFADNSTDKVWELLKDRNDNGAPIFSRLAFKKDDMDSPGQYKKVTFVDLTGFISENAEWFVEMYKDDESMPFLTRKITKNQWTNDNYTLMGLGSTSVGATPLGGMYSDEDDVAVKPFNARINVQQTLEKLQVVLYNNQRDVRVVFRAMVVYAEQLPKDHYPNPNIL